MAMALSLIKAWHLCAFLCIAAISHAKNKATVSATIAGEPTNFLFDRNRGNQNKCNCSSDSDNNDEDNGDDEGVDPYAGCIASFAEEEDAFNSSSACPFVFKTPKTIFCTEFGEFKVVVLGQEQLLQRRQMAIGLLTLEPYGLLLPQYFNGPSVFYVHKGQANFWHVEEKQISHVLILGEAFALSAGVPFFVYNAHSNEKLQMLLLIELSDLPSQHADLECFYVAGGVYPATVMNGFPEETMAAPFKVSAEDLFSLLSAQDQGPVVNATQLHRNVLASAADESALVKLNITFKKKDDHHRLLDEKYIFRNQNGWSVSMDRTRYNGLEEADVGMFAVGLKSRSMVAPYWNSRMTEIGVVTHGRGLIQVARSNGSTLVHVGVKAGSVFIVPRFYPSSKLAMNDSDFEFVGFTTSSDPMQPYFLAGTNAMFKLMDMDVLSFGFNGSKRFIHDLLESQPDRIILTTEEKDWCDGLLCPKAR